MTGQVPVLVDEGGTAHGEALAVPPVRQPNAATPKRGVGEPSHRNVLGDRGRTGSRELLRSDLVGDPGAAAEVAVRGRG